MPPAQLGKATVKRYRRPAAATGRVRFSAPDLSLSESDMGIHASITLDRLDPVTLIVTSPPNRIDPHSGRTTASESNTYEWMRDNGVQLPESCKCVVNAG
jgi:hypothetical protein